jgi:hypothetical protein
MGMHQEGAAISALAEQRSRIDEEIRLRTPVLAELAGRREGVHRQMRASEVRRDELVAKSPAARRR